MPLRLFSRRKKSEAVARDEKEVIPPEAELNELYRRLLEEQAVPEAQWEILIHSQSNDQKWKLICTQKEFKRLMSERSATNESGGDDKTPEHYISLLSDAEPSLDTIQSLRIQLSTSPKSWLASFFEKDGVEPLYAVCCYVHEDGRKKPNVVPMAREIMLCLRAIMNVKFGMDVVLGISDLYPPSSACGVPILTLIAQMFDLADIKICEQVIQLLTVATMCEGQSMVLASLDAVRKRTRAQFRFAFVLEALQNFDWSWAMKAHLLTFVNALIMTGEDVLDRMDIRAEFLYLGFLKLLEKLQGEAQGVSATSGEADATIMFETQAEVFLRGTNADNEEVLEATSLDLGDPDVLFNALHSTAAASGSVSRLLSVLHHLLVIPSHPTLSMKYWTAIERVLHKLVVGSGDDEEVVAMSFEDLCLVLDYKKRLDSNEGEEEVDDKPSSATATEGEGRRRTVLVKEVIKPDPKTLQELKRTNQALTATKVKMGQYAKEIESLQQALSLAKAAVNAEKSNAAQLNQQLQAKSSSQPEAKTSSAPTKKDVLPVAKGAPIPPSMPGGRGPPMPPSMPGRGPPMPPSMPGRGPPMPPSMPGGRGPPMPPSMPGGRGPPMPPAMGGRGPPMPPAMGGRGPRGPPMAPGMGVMSARKAAIVPNVKMRNLFWSKIPDRLVGNTLWKDLSDDGIKFDIKCLEEQFQKAAPAATKAKTTKKASNKPKVVTLLDPKRQQNAGIALARFRMPHEAIKEALIDLDSAKLPAERVSMLLSLVPNAEERSSILEYEGDKEVLGNCEKFYVQILEVPRLEQRLKCMMVRERFTSQLGDVRTMLSLVTGAVTEVAESRKLKSILQTVLALGNYCNGSTPRGGAWGFKLDSLLKLKTVKSTDNKRSLLHFLVDHFMRNDKGLLELEADLPSVREATKFEVSQIQADFNQMNNGVKLVSAQLKLAQSSDTPADNAFVAVMGPFCEAAHQEVGEVEGDLHTLEEKLQTVVKGFGEDPKKFGSKELLGLFKTFMEEMQQTRIHLEKLKLAEEKARAAEAKRRAKAAVVTKQPGQDNLVDSLLGSLKTGNANNIVETFKKRRTARPSQISMTELKGAVEGRSSDAVSSPTGRLASRPRHARRGSILNRGHARGKSSVGSSPLVKIAE